MHTYRNKGTNFSDPERSALRLEGLLPPNEETLDVQAKRVMERMTTEENLKDLNRYNILKDILTINQTLFYKLLVDHVAELAPIVYTPTVSSPTVVVAVNFYFAIGFSNVFFQNGFWTNTNFLNKPLIPCFI